MLVGAILLFGLSPIAQVHDRADLDAIARIKDEALQRSQVMDLISYLTDVYGPRLTGSPNLKNAAEYAVGKMSEWGVSNPHLESWGPFGKGWSRLCETSAPCSIRWGAG